MTGASRNVCKLRGITLNYSAWKLVNFNVISDMILKGDERSVTNVYTEHKNKRKRESGGGTVSIFTEPENKIYGTSFFKRRRLGDNTSVPFSINRGREGEVGVITLDHPCVMMMI